MTNTLSTPPISNCPVLQQAQIVLSDARALRKSVRKLRKSLDACQECPNAGECVPLQEFNRQVDAAISALTAEWGLA
jgi:hypothetical protein